MRRLLCLRVIKAAMSAGARTPENMRAFGSSTARRGVRVSRGSARAQSVCFAACERRYACVRRVKRRPLHLPRRVRRGVALRYCVLSSLPQAHA